MAMAVIIRKRDDVSLLVGHRLHELQYRRTGVEKDTIDYCPMR